jgi:hypothetical protein
MKWIITLFLILAAQAGASELRPSEAILHVIRISHDTDEEEFISVDYKMVLKSDKTLNKEKIHELFQSIDPDKVRFGAYDRKTRTIDMLEPKKIQFTTEYRANSSEVITSVAGYHVIVGIKMNGQQD